MRDHRDSPEFQIGQAAFEVRSSISTIVNLAMLHPDLVRREALYLSNASDELAELVAKLTVKEAAE